MSLNLYKYEILYEKVKFVKTSTVSYKMRLSKKLLASRFLKVHFLKYRIWM